MQRYWSRCKSLHVGASAVCAMEAMKRSSEQTGQLVKNPDIVYGIITLIEFVFSSESSINGTMKWVVILFHHD